MPRAPMHRSEMQAPRDGGRRRLARVQAGEREECRAVGVIVPEKASIRIFVELNYEEGTTEEDGAVEEFGRS